jgi:hypothetical protein
MDWEEDEYRENSIKEIAKEKRRIELSSEEIESKEDRQWRHFSDWCDFMRDRMIIDDQEEEEYNRARSTTSCPLDPCQCHRLHPNQSQSGHEIETDKVQEEQWSDQDVPDCCQCCQ